MKLIIYLAIAAVITVATLATVHSGASTAPAPPVSVPTAAVADQTVVLEVTADADSIAAGATAMITWGDAGAISQLTTSLPWTAPAGMPAVLSAQSQNETTVLTCRILQGTTVLQESTEATAYGICSVSWDG